MATATTSMEPDKDFLQASDELALTCGRVWDKHPGSTKKLYTLHSEALQAVRTRFPSLAQESALCILQRSCIITCTQGGSLLETPCSDVTSVWPCAAGLLMQCAGSSGVLLMDHPLCLPLPVVADVSQRAGLPTCLTGWSGETVLWSSPEAPLTITYHKESQRVAVWQVSERTLSSESVGNLPDLPAVTPWHGAATPLQQLQSGQGMRGMQSGRHQPASTPLGATPSAPTPDVAGSAWPSAIKRPAARTSTGLLSPAMFSTRPRQAAQPPASTLRQQGGPTYTDLGGAGGFPRPAASTLGGAAGAASVMPTLGSSIGLARPASSLQSVFELLHEQTLTGLHGLTRGFPVRSERGGLLLALLCPRMSRLMFVTIPEAHAPTRAGCLTPHLPALAACPTSKASPLSSTQPSRLLVLDPSGCITLHWGTLPICQLTHIQPLLPPHLGSCPAIVAPPEPATAQAAQFGMDDHSSACWTLCSLPAAATSSSVMPGPDAQHAGWVNPGAATAVAGPAVTYRWGGQGLEPLPTSINNLLPGSNPTHDITLQLGNGRQLGVCVDVAPASWLGDHVLQLVQQVVEPQLFACLLQALHRHPGYLSGSSRACWMAVVEVVECALAPRPCMPQPASTGADPVSHADCMSTASPVAATTYNSPQASRFAALSLASPSVSRNLFGQPAAQNSTGSNASSVNMAAAAPASATTANPTAWDLLNRHSQLPNRQLDVKTYPWAAETAVQGGGSRAQAAAAAGISCGAGAGASSVVASVHGLLHQDGVRVLKHVHWLYEDFKLDMCRWVSLDDLGLALALWSAALGSQAAAYWQHYACDLGPGRVEELAAPCPALPPGTTLDTLDKPLDIVSELHALMDDVPAGGSVQGVRCEDVPASTLLTRSKSLLAMYRELQVAASRCKAVYDDTCQDALHSPLTSPRSSPAQQGLAARLQHHLYSCGCRLALLMVQLGWGCHQLDTLPAGLALPLQEMLAQCKHSPPAGWPPAAYALLGREDIAATVSASISKAGSTNEVDQLIAAQPVSAVALDAGAGGGMQGADCTPTLAGYDVTPSVGLWRSHMGHVSADAMDVEVPGTARATGRNSPRAALTPVVTPMWRPYAGAGSTAFAAPMTGTPLPARGGDGNRQKTYSTWANPPEQPTQLLTDEWWSLAYTQRLHLPSHLLPHHTPLTRVPPGAAGSAGGRAPGKQAGAGSQAGGGGSAQGSGPKTGQTSSSRTGATQLMFSRDDRLHVVSRLLSSTQPVMLDLDLPESDPELPAKQQQQLLAASLRTMSLAVGRGALQLGSVQPLPTEPLLLLPLCLAGVTVDSQQRRTTINLDLSAAQPAPGLGAAADITAWPEFHNGVAAGLKLTAARCSSDQARGRGRGAGGGAGPLSRTSLVFQRPDTASYTHAGLLLALGLTGHLTQLAWTDLYRYLSEQHDATTIGAMLGRAACQRCSMDPLTSKMLCLHLPATHPSSFPELDMSPLVQAAALMGLGLLYQGSCHRQMAETMLQEIGRPAGPLSKVPGAAASAAAAGVGVTSDREGYALAAGCALGLITLGTGRAAPGLHDLNIESRLRHLLQGASTCQQQPQLPTRSSVAPYESAALRPLVYGRHDTHQAHTQPLSLAAQIKSLGGRESNTDAATTSSSAPRIVLEGKQPNLSITSPAACMALTLMFLKTQDADVAAAFSIPDTHTALQALRPDLIMLRVLGRALIMWDHVQPSQAWLDAQFPALLKGDLCQLITRAAKQASLSGASQSARNPQAVLLAYVNVLAGACMALGLRHAGSANQPAYNLLRTHLTHLLRAKQLVPDAVPVPGPGVVTVGQLAAGAAVLKLDKGHLEAAVAVVVMAMGVLMAGTGHLPTLQLFDALSQRRHPSHGAVVSGLGITYGVHMAINQAAGLLFLGSGSHSLTTSNESIAALLIAMYPQLPVTPTDNRSHLQAFRHLYVLASQPRYVKAVDVASHQLVHLPLSVQRTASDTPAAALTAAAAGGQGAGGAGGAGTQVAVMQAASKEEQGGFQGRLPGVLKDLGNTLNGPRAPMWGAWRSKSGAGCMDVSAPGSANALDTPTLDAAGHQGPPGARLQHTAAPLKPTPVLLHKTAPCLLPEMDQVQALLLNNPRYWPQTLSRASDCEGSLQLALQARSLSPTPGLLRTRRSTPGAAHQPTACLTPVQAAHTPCATGSISGSGGAMAGAGGGVDAQAGAGRRVVGVSHLPSDASQIVYVKKKTNYLSFMDDPTGVRSLLSQLHTGKAALLVPTAAAWGTGRAGQGRAMAGHDITHLCATFSADPSVMGFAQALGHLLLLTQHLEQSRDATCSPVSGLLLGTGKLQAWAQAAHSLLHVCVAALRESVTGEQPEMTLVHVQLYCLVQGCLYRQSGVPGTCSLRSLHSARQYSHSLLAMAGQLSRDAGGAGLPAGLLSSNSHKQPLMQPTYLEGLWDVVVDRLQQQHVLPKSVAGSSPGWLLQALQAAGDGVPDALTLTLQLGRLPDVQQLMVCVQQAAEEGALKDQDQQQACQDLRDLLGRYIACRPCLIS